MPSFREEIEEIVVDCYGEDEEMSAWGVAFEDGVETPFRARLLGMPVEVLDFQISDANALQCLVETEDRKKKRWIGIEDLDEEDLPEDFRHMLDLYEAWRSGGD
jgi:hypothetical protein